MEESPTYYFCNKCGESFNHKFKLLVHKKFKHPNSESLPVQSTNSDPSEMGTVKLWEFSKENHLPSDPQLPKQNNTMTVDTKIVEFDGVALQMFVIRLGRNFSSSEDQSSLAFAEFVDCEKENGSQEEIFQKVKEWSTVGSSTTSVPPSEEKPPMSAKRARNEFEILKEPQNKLRKISSPSNVSGTSPDERSLELVETSNQTSNFNQWSKEIPGNLSERRFSCNYCDYSSKHKKDLEKHERTHTGKKPYKCEQCDYSATLEIHLQNHECIHTGEKPHEYVSGTSPDERSLEGVETSEQSLKQSSKDIQGNSTERRFSCNYCKYSSKYEHDVYRHERTHTGKKPHRCQQCAYSSTRASNLRVHERIHTGEKPYKCALCNYSAIQKTNLQYHERIHNGEKPYKCAQTANGSKEEIFQELKEGSTVGSSLTFVPPFKENPPKSVKRARNEFEILQEPQNKLRKLSSPSSISGTSPNEQSFERVETSIQNSNFNPSSKEIQGNSTERRFSCNYFEYSSKYQKDLQKHGRTHTGVKPYKCAHCSYSATQKSNLQIHERIHTGEKPYQCDSCDYAAKSYQAMLNHVLTHTGEKPYKCEQCSYSSTNQANLQRHERIHTGEKPYKCAYCSYSAKQKTHLRKHEGTHTRETPQKCEYCSYSSRAYSALQIHDPIHTGEKPYQCDSCYDAAKTFEAMLNPVPTYTEEKPVFY